MCTYVTVRLLPRMQGAAHMPVFTCLKAGAEVAGSSSVIISSEEGAHEVSTVQAQNDGYS
jgi:hypothetical protein